MVLSTSELAQLRSDQSGFWPDTCTLQVITRTSDGQGGYTEAWANTYTLVACRVAPESAGNEQIEGGQLTALSLWVLTIAHNQTIDETMRVVFGGDTYEIARLEDTHSWRTAKRAHLRRLD